jgi:exonuclease SbcD
MRLLHAADLHIGDVTYGFDRSPSHYAMFDGIARCAAAEDVDLIIFAGDVFDTRNPSTNDLRVFATGISTIRNLTEAPIVYSPGNHDGAMTIGDSAKVAAWMQSLDVPGLVAFPDPVVSVINGFHITALPYAHKRSLKPRSSLSGVEDVARVLESMIEDLSDASRPTRGQPSVFIGHVSVLGTFLKEDQALRMGWDVAINPEVFAPWSYAALGHIHRRQKVTGNVWYSGSPIPLRFEDEGAEKGWLVAHFDGAELRDVTPVDPEGGPRYRTFDDVTYDVTDTDVAGNFCRWILPADSTQDLKEEIVSSAIDGGALGVTIKVKPRERATRARVVVKEEVAEKPEDALGLWLSAHGYDTEPYLTAGLGLMGLLEE